MTYQPHPIDLSHAILPVEIEFLVERLAEHAHDVWASQRIQDGWTFGPSRNDQLKQHPSLVPYDHLPEAEKVYDRRMATDTLRAIQAFGFRIEKRPPEERMPTMLLPDLDPWYQRIVRQVAEFRVTHFCLGSELRQLYAVREVGATEAIIFYSARILEVLAATALDSVRLEFSGNVCSNLVILEQYDLVPKGVRYWAHALRRLGNGVRHNHSAFGPDDAELALLFVERWLKWFFCDFQFGLRLEHLTRDGSPLRLHGSERLADLLAVIDELQHIPGSQLEQLRARLGPQLWQTAVAPAVIADIWLDQAKTAEAQDLLRLALAQHPQDARLQQLYILAFSRGKHLDEAVTRLEPLLARDKNDEETVGIGAGVYKRRWQIDRAEINCLEIANRLYRQGWKQSKKANTYLGINAATTALQSGRPAEARRLADEVRKLLVQRADRLRNAATVDLKPDFWTQVTLAEALLLVGELGAAATAYRSAFTCYPHETGSIGSTRQQIREILVAMGVPLDDEELLAKREMHSTAIRVGVTGHRQLDRSDALNAQVRAALEQVRGWAGKNATDFQLVLLTSLAEGADRLVADAVVAPEFAGRLEVVLPLELADYAQDLPSGDSLSQFRRQLAKADAIRFPVSTDAKAVTNRATTVSGPLKGEERNAAYQAAGRSIVDRCQALIAVWDGQPSRGRGGTAEIVDYAREIRRPLVWIHAHAPYKMVAERFC